MLCLDILDAAGALICPHFKVFILGRHLLWPRLIWNCTAMQSFEIDGFLVQPVFQNTTDSCCHCCVWGYRWGVGKRSSNILFIIFSAKSKRPSIVTAQKGKLVQTSGYPVNIEEGSQLPMSRNTIYQFTCEKVEQNRTSLDQSHPQLSCSE